VRPPGFWQHDGVLPRLLWPMSLVYAAATARRMRRVGWTAPVPVICCGGVTAGGAGKTPLALDLGARLIERGVKIAFLSRGYGRRATGAWRVEGRDDAERAGDEPLLLAQLAPTFVDADRVRAARAAIASGAELLVMDDGLQNPGLAKTLSILTVDGDSGFGNRRVIPAGPLREPVPAAARRCKAVVVIGGPAAGAAPKRQLFAGLPVLRARLVPEPAPGLNGRRVIAFAGIARPEKFFASVREVGGEPLACRKFPDHHRYRRSELADLLGQATRADAVLVTTAKDAVRLPPDFWPHATVLKVRLAWDDPSAPDQLLRNLP
jgi:tetraacyldisaccharide 4'-kinase